MKALRPRIFEHGIVYPKITRMKNGNLILTIRHKHKTITVDQPLTKLLSDEELDYLCKSALDFVVNGEQMFTIS